jgi:hypothetical protein
MTETDETERVVRKGDRFTAMGADVEVLRVGRSWADVKVTQPHGAHWNKRQPLPFPDDWTYVEQDERFGWVPDWTIHPGVHWREMIEESGRSQVDIAEEMGVSTKHLSQIVTCTVMPGVTATVAFARAMEASPWLLWRLACDHRLALALGKTDLTRDYL